MSPGYDRSGMVVCQNLGLIMIFSSTNHLPVENSTSIHYQFLPVQYFQSMTFDVVVPVLILS